jgi:hypothetical protein
LEIGVDTAKAPAKAKGDAETDLNLVRGQFEDFVEATQNMRKLAKKCRDYKDGAQYTAKERETFEKRKQPCITDNKIHDRVNTLMGLEKQQRTDPKAYPRTPKHEQASEAATDALRYVADNCEYQRSARKPATENLIVEGWCYGEVCFDKKTNDIRMDSIRIDRGYHDIRSLRLDFEDKEHVGYFTWMDAEVARRKWKGKDDVIDGCVLDMGIGETEHEDKPNRYVEMRSGRKRIQVFTHYHKKDDVWHFSRWCKGGFLEDPKPSPYLDEDKNPTCNIEVQAIFRSSDGDCYGIVQRDLDLQDEHNKRRSKLMHLLNAKRIKIRKGSVENINKLRAEMHKADGVLEYDTSPDEIVVEDNLKEAEGQWRLLQQTDQALSQSAPSIGISDPSGSSGRSKEIEQAAGMLPLMPLFDAIDSWEIRMYRLAWLCVRQFWTAPMWIRVTDNEEGVKFVGLNQPLTQGEVVARQLKDQQIPDEEKLGLIQDIAARPDMEQQAVSADGKQMLDNNVAEIDVDIIISRSADTVNIQAEQFEILAGLAEKYGPQAVPFEIVMDISQLRSEVKRQVRDKLSGKNDPQAAQMAALQQQMQEIQMALQVANVQKTQAQAAQAQASANESVVDAAIKTATYSDPQPTEGEAGQGGKPAAKTSVSVN